MVRFADLQKKGARKKGEPDSSSAEKVIRQKNSHVDPHDWYRRGCRFVQHSFNQAGGDQELHVSEGERLVEEIVAAHYQGYLPQELLIQALHGESDSSFLIANGVNVALYSTLVGSALDMPGEQLMELGLAALLHDIGKVRVPDEILHKKENLTEAENEILRKYPFDSFEILNGLGDGYRHLAECALHVNERIDGSGYPQGLKDDEINTYAQIIGLLDLYERLTHDRPRRAKSTHFDAVKEILKTRKKSFRREFLKALLDTLSIFPVHSLVKLNTGAVARVIKTYEENPLRPKLEVVVDAQKRPVVRPRIIDLREQPILHVAEAVEAESLSS